MIPLLPEQLLHEMSCGLKQLKQENLAEEKFIEASFTVCMDTERQLNNWLRTYTFETRKDEIIFFKKIKPQLTVEMEYLKKIYHAALFKPSDQKDASNFYEYEIDKVDTFFTNNIQYYKYYTENGNDMDELYFLRDCSKNSPVEDPCHIETGYDLIFAEIIALERYKKFLRAKLSHRKK